MALGMALVKDRVRVVAEGLPAPDESLEDNSLPNPGREALDEETKALAESQLKIDALLGTASNPREQVASVKQELILKQLQEQQAEQAKLLQQISAENQALRERVAQLEKGTNQQVGTTQTTPRQQPGVTSWHSFGPGSRTAEFGADAQDVAAMTPDQERTVLEFRARMDTDKQSITRFFYGQSGERANPTRAMNIVGSTFTSIMNPSNGLSEGHKIALVLELMTTIPHKRASEIITSFTTDPHYRSTGRINPALVEQTRYTLADIANDFNNQQAIRQFSVQQQRHDRQRREQGSNYRSTRSTNPLDIIRD
ncbi:MAG: hypothetical protein R3A13_12645, partial [Bdellovibrionota bacterium]